MSCLSFSSAKSKDWDDVLTCHGEEEAARTWSVREKKLGKWIFEANTPDEVKGKKRQTNVPPGPVKVRTPSLIVKYRPISTSRPSASQRVETLV